MIGDGGVAVFEVIAKALAAPSEIAGAAWIATLSVTQALAQFVAAGLAEDIGRYKDSILRGREAAADRQAAEAKRRTALAVEAANLEAARTRKAIAEARIKEAEADERTAEAVLKQHLTERMIAAGIDADDDEPDCSFELAELERAVAQLRAKGGQIFFDLSALRRRLRSPAPATLDLQPQEPAPEAAPRTGSNRTSPRVRLPRDPHS